MKTGDTESPFIFIKYNEKHTVKFIILYINLKIKL